jgi:hypothetical protein
MKLNDLSAAIELKNCQTGLDLCVKCANLFGMPMPSKECISWIMSNPDIQEAGIWIDLPGDSFCLYFKYEHSAEPLNKTLSFYTKFAGLCRKGRPHITLWSSKDANTTYLDDRDFTRVDRTNWDYDGRAINHAQACHGHNK